MSSVFLGLPGVPGPGADTGVGHLTGDRPFPAAARDALGNSRLRRNLAHATSTIRGKRARVVGEVPDWEALRDAGSAIKTATMARLPELLEQLEANVTARGGVVHWARDAAEANRIVTALVQAKGVDEVVKVKSMATQEIGLNEALEAAGIAALETDLAELIVQLAHDKPSHILVPAIHRGRAEIREIGTLTVVESEGNGRMCLTLPETLITVMGIEKVVPTWRDLEVFLQLLPRSSTGERMNPYTSTWAGVTPGDGPQEFHLVLLDNGRTRALADEVGRAALHCIRCSACLNVCPVYERTGGHAYGSVYPGPIGAVLTPQLTGLTGGSDPNDSLPYASSLCGACYDVCPVKINIPDLLVQLRAEHTEAHAGAHRVPTPEAAAMAAAAWVMAEPSRFATAGRAASAGRHGIRKGRPMLPLPPPLSGWTASRDLPSPPRETFRDWWARTRGEQP